MQGRTRIDELRVRLRFCRQGPVLADGHADGYCRVVVDHGVVGQEVGGSEGEEETLMLMSMMATRCKLLQQEDVLNLNQQ